MSQIESQERAAGGQAGDPLGEVARRIEHWRERLIGLSHSLHAEPELSFAEFRSAAKVADLLEEAGFAVDREAYGLPTAVAARYGSGDLVVGFCAEYDALPGIGHGCGHNIIAGSGVGAAIGLAAVADELNLRVVLLGTPAEEHGGGKVVLLEKGAFDELDVAMMAHPGQDDISDPRNSTLTVSRMRVTFTGKGAHAAAVPHKGVNATDAAVITQVSTGLLRQQMPKSYQMAGIIREGGTATNIIPERAVLEYEVRTPTFEELGEFKTRVINCFKAAALATGTSLDIELMQPDLSELRHDEWLMNAYDRRIRALGREPKALTPGEYVSSGSTDMGNVTLYLPGIHPSVAMRGTTGVFHSASFTAEANSPAADEALIDGALALAGTGVELALDAEERSRVITAGSLRRSSERQGGSAR